MHDDLTAAVDELMPAVREELEALVRIDSVSAPDFDPARVRESAKASAAQLQDAGFEGVRLLELEDAHPGVYGEIPAPPGAPTVLLYAHHDVQPPGPYELWNTLPFEPTEVDGRLYGRGTADDKSGVVMHTGAIRALDGNPPVGVKVFLEGEEEISSLHLDAFLAEYEALLASDAIVIADAGTWRVGEPGLTTSLRGLVDCKIEVSTLANGVHSGMWGGAFPDALTVLVKVLATLHDDRGNVAVPGLYRGGDTPVDLSEEDARSQSGVLEGVDMIGHGSITQRLWAGPSASVLAIDAPPVSKAINQLLPHCFGKSVGPYRPGRRPKAGNGRPRRPPGGQRAVGSSGHRHSRRQRPSVRPRHHRPLLRRVPYWIPACVRPGSGRHRRGRDGFRLSRPSPTPIQMPASCSREHRIR